MFAESTKRRFQSSSFSSAFSGVSPVSNEVPPTSSSSQNASSTGLLTSSAGPPTSSVGQPVSSLSPTTPSAGLPTSSAGQPASSAGPPTSSAGQPGPPVSTSVKKPPVCILKTSKNYKSKSTATPIKVSAVRDQAVVAFTSG